MTPVRVMKSKPTADCSLLYCFKVSQHEIVLYKLLTAAPKLTVVDRLVNANKQFGFVH